MGIENRLLGRPVICFLRRNLEKEEFFIDYMFKKKIQTKIFKSDQR